jgi:hypothetical protein
VNGRVAKKARVVDVDSSRMVAAMDETPPLTQLDRQSIITISGVFYRRNIHSLFGEEQHQLTIKKIRKDLFSSSNIYVPLEFSRSNFDIDPFPP